MSVASFAYLFHSFAYHVAPHTSWLPQSLSQTLMYGEFNWNTKLEFYFGISLFVCFVYVAHEHFSKVEIYIEVIL